MRYCFLLLIALSCLNSCKSLKQGRMAERELSQVNLDSTKSPQCAVVTQNNQILNSDCKIDLYKLKDEMQVADTIVKYQDIRYIDNYYRLYSPDYDVLMLMSNKHLPVYKQSFTAVSKTMNPNTGMMHTSIGTSVELYVAKDKEKNTLGYIHDYQFIAPLVRNNPKSNEYLKKYVRYNTNRKINRYASLLAIAASFLVSMNVDGGNTQMSNTDKIRIYSSVGLFFGGLTNWTIGGIYRSAKRRLPLYQAVVEYNR